MGLRPRGSVADLQTNHYSIFGTVRVRITLSGLDEKKSATRPNVTIENQFRLAR